MHISLNPNTTNTILISDLLGKIVLTQNDLKKNNTLSIKDLWPGVYFYKIVSGSKEISGKFIKE
ncbi:MAG: T9SS type A sorting domain-containing protein [Bacteroidetes bacterium]|nr:T9SS type A sorting domain-containing protein [Bacteroidota bacterium]